MNPTWVVVADSARARIFALDQADRELREIRDLVHPEARSRDRDLTSDRPGRTFDSRGRARHAKQPEHSPHEIQAQDFANELARVLEQGRKAGEFQSLVLIAGPRFLGRLHQQLSAATAALVAREIRKNLGRRSVRTIRAAVGAAPGGSGQ